MTAKDYMAQKSICKAVFQIYSVLHLKFMYFSFFPTRSCFEIISISDVVFAIFDSDAIFSIHWHHHNSSAINRTWNSTKNTTQPILTLVEIIMNRLDSAVSLQKSLKGILANTVSEGSSGCVITTTTSSLDVTRMNSVAVSILHSGLRKFVANLFYGSKIEL